MNPLKALSFADLVESPTAFRRKAGSVMVEAFFRGLSGAGRLHPRSRPEAHGLELLTDIPYLPTGEKHHLLDVYRPKQRSGKLPVCLYVHGGGFRILSKETHWLMGLMFARRDMVVFSINYRLAPKHPFPAAHEDAFAALRWVLDNAEQYGGDTSRLVLAGESAGGNIVSSMAIALSAERPEPWAQSLYATGARPLAVLPACGIFEVSNPERFADLRMPKLVRDRLTEVSRGYLPDDIPAERRTLADPLTWYESDAATTRDLPPFFLPVGTGDFLYKDTERMTKALERRGIPVEAKYYDKEIHAFHALYWRKAAKACWRDHYAFLDRYVPRDSSAA
jgi:acetyl esterase